MLHLQLNQFQKRPMHWSQATHILDHSCEWSRARVTGFPGLINKTQLTLCKKIYLKHFHILENICIINDLSHPPATHPQFIKMYFLLHDPSDPRITHWPRGYNCHSRITIVHTLLFERKQCICVAQLTQKSIRCLCSVDIVQNGAGVTWRRQIWIKFDSILS